jgi:hypothetical protein
MELCRQAWRAIAGGLGALILFAAWPAVAAVWTPDHVVIVIEENLSPHNLVPELTYLTGLMRDNANFTNSHAIDHPSQPNYLALYSGDAQGTGSQAKRNPDGSNPIVGGHTQIGTDDPPADTPLDRPNLGAALIRAGHSFAGYAEDLPYPGFTGISHTGPPGSGIDYQRKHNPWVNWQATSDAAIGRNQLPSTVNLPFTAVYRLSRRQCGFCSVAEFGHRRTQSDQRCAWIIGRSARDQLRSRDGHLAARPH